MMTKAEAEAYKMKLVQEKTKLGDIMPKQHAPRKLSIACGQNKPKGFKGIDIGGDADIVHDLFTFPWPIKTSSVQEVECSHFVEHIPHYLPQFEGVDGWVLFFNELYRIMKDGGLATFVHPYSMHVRADWDPTHTRRIHWMTWHYMNEEWRKLNKLDHYQFECDFEVITINNMGMSDEYMARSAEQQEFQTTFYWNVIADLQVIIKARK